MAVPRSFWGKKAMILCDILSEDSVQVLGFASKKAVIFRAFQADVFTKENHQQFSPRGGPSCACVASTRRFSHCTGPSTVFVETVPEKSVQELSPASLMRQNETKMRSHFEYRIEI